MIENLPITQAQCVMGDSKSPEQSIWPRPLEVNWLSIPSSVNMYEHAVFKRENICWFWGIFPWQVGGITFYFGCGMLFLMICARWIAQENYIQGNSIRDIRAKFGIHHAPQSPDTGKNSEAGISNFRISGQSLIKENFPNSRTSDDIDIKFGPVTKIDKRNKTASKKIDVAVMSKNYDVINIFRIFGQLGAIRRPDSRHRDCKSYIFSNRNLFFTKTANRTKKSLTQFRTIALSKGIFLDKKR